MRMAHCVAKLMIDHIQSNHALVWVALEFLLREAVTVEVFLVYYEEVISNIHGHCRMNCSLNLGKLFEENWSQFNNFVH